MMNSPEHQRERQLMSAGRTAEDFCPHVCRTGENAELDKWQNMHRHRRGRPRSGLANKDGAASPERYPRVFKGGRQMIRTGLFLPIIVTASTDCRHTEDEVSYE